MTLRVPPAAFPAVLAVACGGPSIEGGSVVAPDAPADGVLVATYRLAKCTDASGAAAPTPDGAVRVFDLGAARYRLLEARAGLDSISTVNATTTAAEMSFDVVLTSDDGTPSLRRYRVPREGAAPGTFAIAKRFQTAPRAGGFTGRFTTAVLTCALDPELPASPG